MVCICLLKTRYKCLCSFDHIHKVEILTESSALGVGRLLEGGGCLLPKHSDNGMMKIWYRSLIVGIWQPARLVIQIIFVIKYLILNTKGAVRHLRTTTLYMQVWCASYSSLQIRTSPSDSLNHRFHSGSIQILLT